MTDMASVLAWICLTIYLICSFWFLISLFFQLHLVIKSTKRGPILKKSEGQQLPTVTIQVPVYNERHVITQLLAALQNMDYPRERLEIQVLDDSTDITSSIIDRQVTTMKQEGINICVLRRSDRKGYKAGALQEALPFSSGEFIAILDADFVPAPDTIRRLVGHFEDPQTGTVQARWSHNNLMQNMLTRVQAFLIESHFTIEQHGRSNAGYLINFNGTAGMWRRQCIIDSGGWNGNILTEDLELSYRAQLKGWKMRYDNTLTIPSDLPEHMTAFKTQQFRWAKGMAQTLSAHCQKVVKSPMPRIKKWHALFHLSGSLAFVAVMGTVLMSVPVLAARHYIPLVREYSYIICITGITLPLLCIYYYFGTRKTLTPKVFWSHLPAFLVIYMALSVQNAIAVVEGIFGKPGIFVRTPKLRHTANDDEYIISSWTSLNTIELVFACYMFSGIALSIYWSDYFLLLFFVMMLAGLLLLLFPLPGQQRPAADAQMQGLTTVSSKAFSR